MGCYVYNSVIQIRLPENACVIRCEVVIYSTLFQHPEMRTPLYNSETPLFQPPEIRIH